MAGRKEKGRKDKELDRDGRKTENSTTYAGNLERETVQ